MPDEYFKAVVLGGSIDNSVVALPGGRRFDNWTDAIVWCDQNKVGILNRDAAEELAKYEQQEG